MFRVDLSGLQESQIYECSSRCTQQDCNAYRLQGGELPATYLLLLEPACRHSFSSLGLSSRSDGHKVSPHKQETQKQQEAHSKIYGAAWYGTAYNKFPCGVCSRIVTLGLSSLLICQKTASIHHLSRFNSVITICLINRPRYDNKLHSELTVEPCRSSAWWRTDPSAS